MAAAEIGAVIRGFGRSTVKLGNIRSTGRLPSPPQSPKVISRAGPSTVWTAPISRNPAAA